jgi:hypothetical protein
MQALRFPRLLLVGLLALLALAPISARPAAAAAPVITTDIISVTTPTPIDADCGEFQILATFNVERRNITIYDDAGHSLQQIRHASFTGTLFNSASGASVPYEGTFTRTQDFVANSVTFTGLHLMVRIPGQGVLALDVGQTIIDFSSQPPAMIFEAGQHEFNAQVCQLLS